jgi:lipopolysaccharide/colanic/teichoic acid biosynthesis glycosyltransferase
MLKRLLDIVISMLGLVLLSPFLLVIAICINVDSAGSPIFKQVRVGRFNKDFFLYKFRTMHANAEKYGQLTIGKRDPRITSIGFFLRKYKLDELPQLANVLLGDMSLVGPRPEVRKYVAFYSTEQLSVLSVRPGITDPASIKFIKENELLAQSKNPEVTYINEIMPQKLSLNLAYIQKQSLATDIYIIFSTLIKIIR